MIKFKQQITKEDKKIVEEVLGNLVDNYRDFYITKDNFRFFIQENKDLLFKCLKEGDKIGYDRKEGIILGIGWSDKSPRKYIKILAENNQNAERLLKVFLWNFKEEEFWCKIKKKNPLKEMLEKNNFRYFASRGAEVLLCRKIYKKEIKESKSAN